MTGQLVVDADNGSGTPPQKLVQPVLHLKTSESGWYAAQLMCEDSNGKVFSQVGQHSTGADVYQWNITLDPDNTHGRTGATTFAGDYFVDFQKDYSDPAAIVMRQRVFGANDGYVLTVRDDFNSGGGNQYGIKPYIVEALDMTFKVNGSTEALKVETDKADFSVPVQFPSYTTTERNALTAVNGMQIYNSTDSKMQAYAGGAWVDLHT